MRSDPAMLGASPHARVSNDAYFTLDADMCVEALLDAIQTYPDDKFLEPAAGRGHLVKALIDNGVDRKNITSSDLVLHPDPLIKGIKQQDIKSITSLIGYQWVITNLPYDIQDELLEHLLPLARDAQCAVATLTRASWHYAKSRRKLVHQNPDFAGVVHLPRRPWWVDDRKASPRHDFAWNVWNSRRINGLPTLLYPKEKP